MKLKESLITRAEFLKGCLLGLGALFVGQSSYPLFRFLMPAEADLGPLEVKLSPGEFDLTPNSGKIFPFGHKPALLIKTDKGEWVALSAVCSHFECTVHYDPASRQIVCPCHKGFYDVYGKNIKGPPPKPLKSYEVKVVPDGLLIVRKAQGK